MTEIATRTDFTSRRVANGATRAGEVAAIVAAHVAAMVVAGVCTVVLPLTLFTLATAGLLAIAVVSNGDLGGPLFFPAGALVIGLAGGASFALACALGVSSDLARRWLRWPMWTSPAAVVAGCCVGVVLACTYSDFDPRGLLALGALCLAAFASYWVPLALVCGAWRLLRRRPASSRTEVSSEQPR